MMTFATGCSGIGAPEVAWGDRLGWKCLWCSEIEPFPSAVLKHHWPDVPNVGDFLTIAKRIDRDELEAPDVFIAGTPCQAFSVAGLRKSLDDHRGGLTLEYIRIADAMDAQRKRRGLPETVFVWENVPGVFSTKDNAFGCFLGGMLGLDDAVLPAGGKWRHYGDLVAKRRVAWRLLDAQYFGVAQRRRRVFVVSTARPGVSPARALFEFGSVPRTSPPRREAGQGSPSDAESRTGKASYGIGNGQADSAMNMQEELSQTLHCMHDPNAVMCVPINSMVIGKDAAPTDRQTTGIGDNGEPSPTLQANHHHAVACVDKHMCSGVDRVPALEREGAHNVVLSQYGDIAGAVTARNDSSPCADRGPTVICRATQQANAETFDNLAPTLTEAAGTSGNNQPVICYESNPTDARQKETDVSPTVLSRWGTGGNQTPFVQTFSISENVIDRDPKNGGHHLGVSDGPQFTLDTAGAHGVAVVGTQFQQRKLDDVCGPVTTFMTSVRGDTNLALTGFVRRLTTVECARLQGFPDHHTEIPWRGKPASECPRGPQYKAYGNSMCTNVIEWLGRVIEKELNNANSTSKMAQ